MQATVPMRPTILGAATTDVPGARVGQLTDSHRPSGCMMVPTEQGANGGMDVHGAAPGTRETDPPACPSCQLPLCST